MRAYSGGARREDSICTWESTRPGSEVLPLEVDDLLGPQAVVHAGDDALADGDRGVLPYFSAQEVHEGAVGQVEVAGDGAARGVYKVLADGHAKAAFRINSRR